MTDSKLSTLFVFHLYLLFAGLIVQANTIQLG